MEQPQSINNVGILYSMFQIDTKILHGPLMLDNSAFFFSYSFRTLVGMVLINCNRFKSKNKFLVVGLKFLFCSVPYFS